MFETSATALCGTTGISLSLYIYHMHCVQLQPLWTFSTRLIQGIGPGAVGVGMAHLIRQLACVRVLQGGRGQGAQHGRVVMGQWAPWDRKKLGQSVRGAQDVLVNINIINVVFANVG